MSNVNNKSLNSARNNSPGQRQQQNKGLSLFKKMDAAMKQKFEAVQIAMSAQQELTNVNKELKKDLDSA